MNITYKILDNGTAVILTRQPTVVYDDIRIGFTDAPEGATAIFENNGKTLYRTLEGDSCIIPPKLIVGETKVTVVLLDGSAVARRWHCEELSGERLEDGGILVSPNDMNLPQRYVELKLENQTIRQHYEELKSLIAGLEDRLEKLYEGYDIV